MNTFSTSSPKTFKFKGSVIPFYSLLFLLALSLGSCHLFQKTPQNQNNTNSDTLEPITTRNTKTDTSAGNYVPVTEATESVVTTAPDTVRWCDTIPQLRAGSLVICFEKTGNGNIKADTVAVLNDNPNTIVQATELDTTIRTKLAYRVVVMLPFMSKTFAPAPQREIPGASIKAIEFYEGVMMALDSLKREGVSLFVDVYDTERDTNVVKGLLQLRTLQEADLILGPLTSSNLMLVAEFAKTNQKVLVSPLNSRSDITSNNPYYLQISPSFEVHSKYIINQLNKIKPFKRYRSQEPEMPNYVVLALENDSNRVASLQADYAIYKNNFEARLPTIIRKKVDIDIDDIKPMLQKGRLNVVIMPTYKKESFVYNSLRELQKLVDKVERYKGYDIAVIGMNRWRYYNRVNFEYYEYLNLHFTSDYFAANNSYLRAFKRDYKAVHGIGSREFALKGFDVMLFCGRMLERYGTSFQAHLWKENSKYRHTSFNVQPIYESTGVLDQADGIQAMPVIKHYQNQYLNVVRFKEYELTRADDN
ncbi:MAG: hypothetical protein AB8E82_14805 [Aureispira sp.]